MQEYMFTIEGIPISWKRPWRKGNMYFDPQLRDKFAVQQKINELINLGDPKIFPIEKPMHVLFEFFFPFPKSMPKKQQFTKPYIGKKDLSNLIKFYEDALNKILWADDRYIISYQPPFDTGGWLWPQKMYSPDPKTVIHLWTE